LLASAFSCEVLPVIVSLGCLEVKHHQSLRKDLNCSPGGSSLMFPWTLCLLAKVGLLMIIATRKIVTYTIRRYMRIATRKSMIVIATRKSMLGDDSGGSICNPEVNAW
jgi:hypothetical protein